MEDLQSILSNLNSLLAVVEMFELQKVPITEIGIKEVFCLETFKGHGNFVRIVEGRITRVRVRQS